jgi:hypothetical protein
VRQSCCESRFSAQRKNGENSIRHPDRESEDVSAHTIHQVAPGVLMEHGKTMEPGIGRAIGTLANITWDRALGYPIERPKSVTTAMLEEAAGIK